MEKKNSLSANLANYTIDSISQFTMAVRGFIGIRLGGVYSIGNEYRLLNLMNNPAKTRYADSEATATAVDGEFIGERYSVETRLLPNKDFLDSVGGLTGYTYDEGFTETNNSSVIGNMDSTLSHASSDREKYLGNTFDRYGKENKLENIYSTDEENTFNNGDSVDNKIFVDNVVLTDPVLKNDGNLWAKTYDLYDERYKDNSSSMLDTTVKDGNDRDNRGDKGNRLKGESIHDMSISFAINDRNGLDTEKQTLLYKTNELFKSGKIGSMINRFYNNDDKEISGLQTAVDNTFGLSRGRNLLKANTTDDYQTGYLNPYCRVWTSHYQYTKFKNLIRYNGFKDSDELFPEGVLRPNNGTKRLKNFSSLMEGSGLPQIAPYKTGKPEELIKKCMFSIENLAWKDIKKEARVDGKTDKNGLTLSKEQIGPNGGRIMWFPPYNLKVNENVSVGWNANNFIGRGEPIYTYTNTERTGTLSFTILVDHPSVVDSWAYGKEATGSNEQELLRFFAGCASGVQEKAFKPIENKKDDVAGNVIENPPVITPKPEKENPDVILRYFVFFPNDLSCIDHRKGNISLDKYIKYLKEGGEGNTGYEMGNGPIYGCIDTDVINGTSGRTRTNKKIVWHYHVDADKINERLYDANYKDISDFGLNNSSKFKELIGAVEGNSGNSIVINTLKLTGDYKKNTFTFEDLINMDFSDLSKYYDNVEGNIQDNEIEINVDVVGHASQAGYKNRNEDLSMHRAAFIKDYLETKNFTDKNKIRAIEGSIIPKPEGNNDVSSIEHKIGRCAEVVVRISRKHKEPNLERTTEGTMVSQENIEQAQVKIPESGNEKAISREIENPDVKYGFYDDEYLYFQKINEENDVIRRNLVEKVQFFDPAFHSITPEGFNARLTFLHQCTRQGPTMSASDMAGESPMGAGNLAFGRMPVCVLKIGDFYNTKILIDSLSIDYMNGDGIQWDLNPEGIGIQPMLANVTLGIKFLGGSDISGPIARLQDAVSYNFFANTSVYDRRADYREDWIKEDDDKSMAWNPLLVNNTGDVNVATHREFSTTKKGKVAQTTQESNAKGTTVEENNQTSN